MRSHLQQLPCHCKDSHLKRVISNIFNYDFQLQQHCALKKLWCNLQHTPLQLSCNWQPLATFFVLNIIHCNCQRLESRDKNISQNPEMNKNVPLKTSGKYLMYIIYLFSNIVSNIILIKFISFGINFCISIMS